MKLSKNFVREYIDIDVDIKTLAEDMTKVGNEYEEAGKLINATNLIIGEVIEDEESNLYLKTSLGGTKILQMAQGELLPRIC